MLPDQLWLTQAALREADAARLLGNAPAMHHRVMAMFPDHLGEHPRQAAGVLYRIERSGEQTRLLVQSRIAPDLSGLEGARTVSLLPLLEYIATGTTVHYRIAANPTKSVRTADSPKRRGRRKALHEAEAEAWWHTKARQAGLQTGTVTVRPHDLASDRSPLHRHPTRTKHTAGADAAEKDPRIVNHGTRFDGLAKVEDPHLAVTAVLEGIGRGRSYGLGLLSLAPTKG